MRRVAEAITEIQKNFLKRHRNSRLRPHEDAALPHHSLALSAALPYIKDMDKALHTVAFTAGFLSQAKAEGMTEAEMEAMVRMLALNPQAGDAIQGLVDVASFGSLAAARASPVAIGS